MRMFRVILLLILRFSRVESCPIYCQCYSALNGYHVKCSNAKLREIPLNLTQFLQITEHQNLIVDLSSNFLSKIPCYFFENSHLLTLNLSQNRFQTIPSCFSRSSIENLILKDNLLQFNQTTILSSSKLLHLDISSNSISSLPRTFFLHLRKLRRLILDGNEQLFEQNQWIRSLTTRNQLTLIICQEHFRLSQCLFEHLFRTKKLFALELNHYIHCDCSFVYLPLENIHFHACQLNDDEKDGICHVETSIFERGNSFRYLKNEKYQQICREEYRHCQDENVIQLRTYSKSLISTKIISLNTTVETIVTARKENFTMGMIISFVLVFLIVTIVCLYVFLSGQFYKTKTRKKKSNLFIRKTKQNDRSSVNSSRFDECISIENLNMNFKPYSDDEDNKSNLTFYSLNNSSSKTILQSSMTELASLTSTIDDSSIANEFVILSPPNKQRIY